MTTQPEMKTPILPSEGYNCMKATRHFFVGFEQFVIEYYNGPKVVQGLVYECTETGARRRWGYQ
jgi:hypothetical protein